MKIVSWNVNGIRAILKKNFLKDVAKLAPDILCIQETKAHPDQVDLELADYAHHYWNAAERKGYSGTAVFSKVKPKRVSYGIGVKAHDQEGRVITLEFPNYHLVNVYTPNSGDGLRRLAYRQTWDKAFLRYAKKLDAEKPVIICGDLNVAHEEIDLARPNGNHFNAGFTDEERDGFRKLLAAQFIDTFRELYKDPGHYSWWSYRTRARERNIGWRIDYVCMSAALRPKLRDATIHANIKGSDHCPVGLELK